jgi:hypothetical protein
MAEAALCPKCKKEILSDANSCVYCGEQNFIVPVPGKENEAVRCDKCRGTGQWEMKLPNSLYPFWMQSNTETKTCGECNGSGAVKGRLWTDLRTGATWAQVSSGVPVPWPASWGPRPSLERSPTEYTGCLSMFIVAFTFATTLMRALLL